MTNRQQVVQLRGNNPCATLEQISTQVGLSRERVRQILKSELLPTANAGLGKRNHYICPQCGKVFYAKRKPGFCSRKCRHDYFFIDVSCAYCGTMTKRYVSYLVSRIKKKGMKNAFCSYSCSSKYTWSSRRAEKEDGE